MEKPKSIFDIHVKDHDKADRALAEYRGKVMLIVNVASECGLADRSYKELASLLAKYHDRGLCILLFPCQQFLNQEFGDASRIRAFVDNYHKNFILMDAVDVRGRNIHPLFQYLTDNLHGRFTNSVKWNFTYFLVGRDGSPIRRYGPTEHIKDDDPDLVKAIAEGETQPRGTDAGPAAGG